MKKVLIGLLLSVAALTASASPAQAEHRQFCEQVANNYKAGADAKKLGMPADEIQSRLFMFIMTLKQHGMPDPLIELHVQAIVDGYMGKSSAQEHFEGCLTTDLI
jgi:hypothetical protein